MLSEAKHRVGARLRVTKNVTPPASPAKVQRSENLATIMTSQPPLQFLERGWPKAGGRARAQRARLSAAGKSPTRLAGESPTLQKFSDDHDIAGPSPILGEGVAEGRGEVARAARKGHRLRENAD